MSKFADLIVRLKKEANVQASEGYDDAKLSEWLRAAVARHVPEQARGDAPDITDDNDEPVILLAWESLSFARAARYVNQTDARGNAGTDDRTSPYARNMNLAAALRRRYNDIVAQLETVEQGGEIIQGRLVIRSEITDTVPGKVYGPIIIGLQATNITPDSCDVVWAIGYSDTFTDAYLYTSEGTIYDPSNTANDDGIPSVAEAAVQIGHFQDQASTGARISDLTPGTTSHFLLVVKTRTGRYYYSNEIVVVNPSA